MLWPILLPKGRCYNLTECISVLYWKTTRPYQRCFKRRVVTEGNNIPVLYVNQVGGQDEVVFDGYSTAMNADGSIAMMAKGFQESLETVALTKSAHGQYGFVQGNVEPIATAEAEAWNGLVLGLRDYVEKQV